ncbi:cortical protein marker for cell polarity-domain-containing protein [Sporodiniella umbellata]|nr:cortical protein marker for cell polarity-domain-containing protein [Sporodiniella umbellata]
MQLAPLQQGLDGPVRSLYCTNASVYVGGEFNQPIGYNSTQFAHAALWTENQWTALPWKGFNGPVYTIAGVQQSILFGGKFNTIGDRLFANQSYQQSFDLGSLGTLSAGNGGYDADPTSVVCSQSPWYLQDGNPGYWQAEFPFSIQPSVFRLKNTHRDWATEEFNIIALGSNDYYSLAYTDPDTQQVKNCSQKCILNNTLDYQDFIVTSPLSANGIRININTWLGTRGGLGGVQIFRSDTLLQPHASSNNSCHGTNPSSSTTTTTGHWIEKFAYGTYQDFLISTFPASERLTVDLSVTYRPQRNYDDQRTLIYQGPIHASDGFQPSVVLKLDPTATATTDTVSVIANSIEFIRTSPEILFSSLLEYRPYNQSWAALPDQLALGAIVRTLSVDKEKVYIGGEFVQEGSNNIVAYDSREQKLKPLSTGLNGRVSTSFMAESMLVLGGHFTQTQSNQSRLNYIARYDPQRQEWSEIDQGVNGVVEHVYGLDEKRVGVSGQFTQLGNGQKAYQNAQWDLPTQRWQPPSTFVAGASQQIALNRTARLYLGQIRNAQSYQVNTVANMASPGWGLPHANVTSGVVYADGVILSGQFLLDGETYQVVFYQDGQWQGWLKGIEGDVSRLLVVEQRLYLAGRCQGQGIIVFDLKEKKVLPVPGVYNRDASEGEVTVLRSNQASVFVGGRFDQAGAVVCGPLCALSTHDLSWSSLGENRLTGKLSDFVLQEEGTIVAVGDLAVDGQRTSLAQLENNRWIAPWLPVEMPSLTTLVALDTQRYMVSGSYQNQTRVGYWSRKEGYQALENSGLDGASSIQQLMMVPTGSHAKRDGTERQRVLMAVGHLLVSPGQSASAAIYDGQWHPYLLTARADGSAGQVHQFLTRNGCCTARPRKYLALPAVVLIAIGLSLLILFCLVALGFAVIALRRRQRVFIAPPEWKPRPPTLPPLEIRPFSPPVMPFSALLAAAMHPTEAPASEEKPKMYYAKYPFEAKEFGELPLATHTPIVVTDMTDNVWWMGYKEGEGGQAISGLFPSNYVTTRKPPSA